MKRLPFFAVMVAATVSFGDTFRTNSVEGLVYLLKRYNGGGHTVELESGEYNLTEESSWYTNSTTYASHLYLENIHLKGVEGDREAVKLIGCGRLRVLQGSGSSSVGSLMITNGYAIGTSGNYGRGGGVYGGLTVTNCVVVGNRSDTYGAGGAGGVKFVASLIKNNVSSKSGGGFHGSSAVGCRIEGNVAADNGGGGYGGSSYFVTNCVVVGNSAGSDGGGGAGGLIFTASEITGNCAGQSGGGLHGSTARYCAINGNTAKKAGGGVYSAPELVGCTVSGNVTETNGGSGGYRVAYATNCVFAGNRCLATGACYGGGVSSDSRANSFICDSVISNNHTAALAAGAYEVTLSNCVVTMNHSANDGGGVYKCDVFGGEISFNSANGGGYGGAFNSVISNCVIYANVCSNIDEHAYGAALHTCTAYNSEIYGNYAASTSEKIGSAAAAYKSTLYDCYIHDNCAGSYAGGIRESTAVRCVLSNNVGGNDGGNAYVSDLVDCVVSGSGVYRGTAAGTVFRGIGGTFSLVGNPYSAAEYREKYLWKGNITATNCLFTDNGTPGGGNLVMVQYVTGMKFESYAVNCTIVSNWFSETVSRCTNEYPVVFANCVFAGNALLNGTPMDITFPTAGEAYCRAGSVLFDHCAYGTSKAAIDIGDYTAQGGRVYRFGNEGFGDDPKFQLHRDAEHPFSLRRTSPLIGKGKYEPWMAEAADFRGEGFARANGTSVDIGCYQCWLDPAGTVFSIR